MVKGLMGGAVALAIVAAPAQAACWNADEASAANVRQLQSMLMVAALRCRAAGHPVMEDYNAFVLANRAAIVGQNEKLKVHFIHARGPVEGQRAYDAYTTAMANGYGAAASGGEACAAASMLAREAGMMAGSVEGLVMIAEREGIAAALPEGPCVRAPAPVMMAAVAVAVPAPVAPPAPAQVEAAMVPIEEPMVGDESVAATPVGRVDPAVAIATAPALAPVAPPAPPVAVADATPPAYREAPAPDYPAPRDPRGYAPPQAYYPAPAYAAYPQAPAYPGYPPAYAQAPRYAAQAAYPQPRYAPPPGYAYAPDPAWGDQR